MQLAQSANPDKPSIKFLTSYLKNNLFRFALAPGIRLRVKLFGLVSCVHFPLARKIVKIYYKAKNEPSK